MAINFDASTYVGLTSGSSDTFSHTCSGDNRVLLVAVNNNTNRNITSLTYDGIDLTLVVGTGDGASGSAGIYALGNPSSGANNIEIVFSGSITGRCNIGVASFNGGNPIDVINAFGTGVVPPTSGTISVTLETTFDKCMLFDVVALASGSTSGIGSGQTEVHSNNTDNWFKTSYKKAGVAGSNSMTWTTNGATGSQYCVALTPRTISASVSDVFSVLDNRNFELQSGVSDTFIMSDTISASQRKRPWKNRSKSGVNWVNKIKNG